MDMSKYKGMFLAEAGEHLNNMNQLVLALEKEPGKKEDIDSLFRAAHSIKGMAASMGYQEISELSHKMEDMMDRFRKEEMSVTPEATDILLEGIDALERLVEAVEQDRPADVDIAKIIEKIKGYGAQKLVASGQTLVVSEKPATEVEPPATAHRPLTTGFNISIEISPDSQAPSVRAFLIIRRIKELGDLLSTIPSEAEIKNGKFSGRLSAKISTDAAQDKIEEAIRGGGEVVSVAFEPISAEVSIAEPAEQSKPETPNLKAETVKEHELPKVVKVNTSLLDYFVNAIGELIINKSRLHQVSKGIPSKELKDGLNQLDRLVRDLQTQVMSVRMMQIESITERFPRVIRDLARKEGKEVDLDIEGQDIELDRSIIEGLGNPLIHLIRNCVDHGIELPDERRASGKPRTARISIKASREKDQVSIEVSDDGRGMDPERLKDAAIKKGVITQEQAAEMDNKEALFLTCLPGFSTAKKVSDVSGRGVGMDAVKSAVESMGGGIDINSRVGEGTTITLRLPLTVAIIQSLLVELAPETFAIPINRVLRTLEVEKSDVKMSQKQKLIDFNGYLIPLLSLRKILGLPSLPAQERFIPVVVTEVRGRIVGLVVDKFLGQQETFIKPLGRPLNKISGLSGTTVLGNGRTIFLLDMGNLI
ncbi:MAG: chemotaxis protein CheA [Deltaproteobacteria bacterium]|nr:chemotaxis protein CheA [Deltaproteobacteria bacterium]